MPILKAAADAAKIIIELHGPIDQTKLQKLLYYSQALSMVWYRDALFPEAIEAWSNGPVVAEFWRRHAYESYLTQVREASDEIEKSASTRARAVIAEVLKAFGGFTGSQLSELTHREEPWKIARGLLPPGARSSVAIDVHEIGRYYGKIWAVKENDNG